MSHEERHLSTLGATIRDLFNSILTVEELQEHDLRLFLDIRNAAERFELWAVNLGLYQRGHGSLDYRFRDASLVNDFAFDLLDTLQSSLVKLFGHLSILAASSDIASTSGGQSPAPSDDFSDDSDLEELNRQPWQEVELVNISTSLDRLYRMASKIQDPRLRVGSSKAKVYTEIDRETNTDLMAVYTIYDEQHIREYVAHSRKESQFLCPEYLIERLTKSNTLRRKHFKHWKRHNLKLKAESGLKDAPKPIPKTIDISGVLFKTKPEDRSISIPAFSALTPATDLPAHIIDIIDEVSTVASTNFARQEKENAVSLLIPDLPRSLRGLDRFECPYCYIICSKKLGQGSRWRNHVLHDLRPYMCTDRNCQWGEQLFDSVSQWKSHQASHSSPNTSCDDVRQICDICGEDSVNLDHLASHLEQISIFALPHSTGFETDTSEAGSLNRGSNVPVAGEMASIRSLTSISSANHGYTDSDSSSDINSTVQGGMKAEFAAPNLDLKKEENTYGSLFGQARLPDEQPFTSSIDEWIKSVPEQAASLDYVKKPNDTDEGKRTTEETKTIPPDTTAQASQRTRLTQESSADMEWPDSSSNLALVEQVRKMKKDVEEGNRARAELEARLDRLSQTNESLRNTAASARPTSDPQKAKSIRFKDAIGRTFNFPFHLCKTWRGMEDLIHQAFLNIETIGQHVLNGQYDLIGPNDEIILPAVWESVVEPDWEVKMYMWPLPESNSQEPTGNNTSSAGMIQVFNDPLIWHKLASSPKTRGFIADPAFATLLNKLKERPDSMNVHEILTQDPRIIQALNVLLEYGSEQDESRSTFSTSQGEASLVARAASPGTDSGKTKPRRSFYKSLADLLRRQ